MPTRITAANVNIVKHLFSLQFPSSTCTADAQMMRRAVQRAETAAAGIAQPRVLQQCSTCNVNQTAECVQLVAILAVCLMLQTSTNEWSIRCAATDLGPPIFQTKIHSDCFIARFNLHQKQHNIAITRRLRNLEHFLFHEILSLCVKVISNELLTVSNTINVIHLTL